MRKASIIKGRDGRPKWNFQAKRGKTVEEEKQKKLKGTKEVSLKDGDKVVINPKMDDKENTPVNFTEAQKMKNDPCWDNYKMVGTKKKNGKTVPNCVPEETQEVNELKKSTYASYRDKSSKDIDKRFADVVKTGPTSANEKDRDKLTKRLRGYAVATRKSKMNEARGEDDEGHKRSTESGAGLTQKGVDAYNRKTGGNLQTAVTGKVKAGSKAAGRRKSFCARMGGMKGPMKDEKGRPTRKAMSLRRWKC